MTQETPHIRLGELLKEAEILTSDFIKEALSQYEDQGLPLGKVLVMSGYLSDFQLRNTLDLQYMVNDGLLPMAKAIKVLKIAHKEDCTLADAFEKSGIIQPEEQETNKLGQLLVESKVIANEELDDCLSSSNRTSLPLGHILCHRTLVSQPLINKALLVQQLIRRGQIMRKQGITAIEEGAAREVKLTKLEINKTFKRLPLKNTPLLGDLLIQTNICTERQVRDSLLASVTHCTTLGDALVQSKQVSDYFVSEAIVIQEMMDNSTLELEQAKEALIEMRAHRVSAIQAAAEASTYRMRLNQSKLLIDLLCQTGTLDVLKLPSDVQERTDVNYNQVSYVCKALKPLIGEKGLFSALRCVDLINRKTITHEKAIVAIEFANKSGMDIEQALYMLGVTERTRLREVDPAPKPSQPA